MLDKTAVGLLVPGTLFETTLTGRPGEVLERQVPQEDGAQGVRVFLANPREYKVLHPNVQVLA